MALKFLCPVTCRAVSNDHVLSPLCCPDGQRAPALERAQPTRIALLNARSIANKAFFLSELFSKKHLDFLFLTETWQREMEYTHLNELRPPDCSVFGTLQVSRRGGGLALVYRDRFCCRLMNPDSFDSFELQMTKVGNTDSFYCILIYRPPGPACLFLEDFSEFLSSIIKLENVLLLWDFNLHIDDASCNLASEFLTLTEAFHFKQHVSGPTHTKGHTLDLVFSLGLNIDQLSVMDINVTDHCCIFFNLSSNVDCLPCKPMSQRRIINEITVEKFSVI